MLSSEAEVTAATKLCWAEQTCSQRGWTFDEVFRHQFRISRVPAISSPNWEKCKLGSHWIEHCPHLPMSQVLNRRGQVIGWCLGVAIDATGAAIGGAGGAYLTATATFDAIERRHSQLAGRFALLVQIGDETRYYPDATSGLTAVANAEDKVIASTVTLAINDEIRPSGGRTLQEIQRKSTLYLMGETPDHRVNQVQGNHYVDLSNFTSNRFWPADDTPFGPPDDPRETAQKIAERLQTTMDGMASGFDCVFPINASSDSRLLAAAVPPQSVGKIGSFYVHERSQLSGFEVKSAQQVASHLNLPLSITRFLAGESDGELASLDIKETRAKVALATGNMHPNLRRSVLQSMHVAPNGQLLLSSRAAEVAQASKWPTPPRIPEHITPEFAFQRLAGHGMQDLRKLFGERTTERYWEKYKTWFAKLPEGARTRAVDLSDMELWLSSAMGADYYTPRQQFYANPFSEQWLLHQTMRFDPKERKDGQLVKMLLDHLSPGLAEVPYARQLFNAARENLS